MIVAIEEEDDELSVENISISVANKNIGSLGELKERKEKEI